MTLKKYLIGRWFVVQRVTDNVNLSFFYFLNDKVNLKLSNI